MFWVVWHGLGAPILAHTTIRHVRRPLGVDPGIMLTTNTEDMLTNIICIASGALCWLTLVKRSGTLLGSERVRAQVEIRPGTPLTTRHLNTRAKCNIDDDGS